MLNFEVLSQYMDNDPEIISAVLMTYMKDYENASTLVQKLQYESNWSELFLVSHNLKSILAGFGEKITVSALERIETQTRLRLPPDDKDMALIIEQLDAINTQIHNYLSGVT